MDSAFKDEFPQAPERRKRLIDNLAQQANVIEGGVVDADKGKIYRVAPTRRGQLMSVWRLSLFILLGFLLPLALAFGRKLLPVDETVSGNWPSGSLQTLLDNYVLILLGSGAHFAVAALKASKIQTGLDFQALNDWVLWVHVREVQIFKGIAYIWTGYILLSFGIHKLDWYSAFFAGYSIDSVTELFLGRFEATVAEKTKLLTKS
jgi:hypothetical protein